MGDETSSKGVEANEEGWPIFELWKKYEDIAMHFNDLLIKLRTQALGAVAALTTIIGIFAKGAGGAHSNWQMVTFAFAVLLVFWCAIWALDFCYYNRLLIGAAEALCELEAKSKNALRIKYIEMSTTIEASVAGSFSPRDANWKLVMGRWAFYTLVFLALLGGCLFSWCQYVATT
jgi:hypothetical protein